MFAQLYKGKIKIAATQQNCDEGTIKQLNGK
jgi:hypothetical protein